MRSLLKKCIKTEIIPASDSNVLKLIFQKPCVHNDFIAVDVSTLRKHQMVWHPYTTLQVRRKKYKHLIYDRNETKRHTQNRRATSSGLGGGESEVAGEYKRFRG